MSNTKAKKRNELSLANKIKVIESHEKDKKSSRTLAEEFGVEKT